MSENTNKDKIENLDSLIVKRSNFNIGNEIISLYIIIFIIFVVYDFFFFKKY